MTPGPAALLLVACVTAARGAPCPPGMDRLPPASPAGQLEAWSCELRFAAPDEGLQAPGPFSFRPWYGLTRERYTLNWHQEEGFHLEVELSPGPSDSLQYPERLDELAGFLTGFLDIWDNAMFRSPCETVPDSCLWEERPGFWQARYALEQEGLMEQRWDREGFPRVIQGWQEGIQWLHAELSPVISHGERQLGQADLWLESGLVHYRFRLEYCLVSRFLMPARLLWTSSEWGMEQELRVEFRDYQWRIKDSGGPVDE